MVTHRPPHLVSSADGRSHAPRSVRDVLDSVSARDADPEQAPGARVATGFDLLDRVLDGGLRVHDLMLLGGSPGVGKTVAALQMARHAARHGRPVLYLSYEHDEATMLGRLLAVELGEMSHPDIAPDLDRLRSVVVDATAGFCSLEAAVRTEPLVAQAYQQVDAYADRLMFLCGSSASTDVAAIQAAVAATGVHRNGVVVIDYLQKVAECPPPPDEAEKVTRVTERLKDMALTSDLAVVALVAADVEGLRAGRVRLHHLRGSSALAYECDVAVILNEKHDVVSRVHLAYDAVRAAGFRQQVVFSIEKNRGGPAMVDLEFRKDFLHYRFDPRGSHMAERSVDDRLEPH